MQEPRYPLPRVILHHVSKQPPDRAPSPGRRECTERNTSSLAHSAPGFVFGQEENALRGTPPNPGLAEAFIERLEPALSGQKQIRRLDCS